MSEAKPLEFSVTSGAPIKIAVRRDGRDFEILVSVAIFDVAAEPGPGGIHPVHGVIPSFKIQAQLALNVAPKS